MKVQYPFAIRIEGSIEFNEEQHHSDVIYKLNQCMHLNLNDLEHKLEGWQVAVYAPRFIEYISEHIEVSNITFEENKTESSKS